MNHVTNNPVVSNVNLAKVGKLLVGKELENYSKLSKTEMQ